MYRVVSYICKYLISHVLIKASLHVTLGLAVLFIFRFNVKCSLFKINVQPHVLI